VHDDETTRRGPTTSGSASGGTRSLALTILSHPSSARVGDTHTSLDGTIALARSEPELVAPTGLRAPLVDPFVSRSPLEIRLAGDRVVIDRAAHGSTVRVDRVELGEEVDLPLAQLASGVVIELADRVAVLLHLRRPFVLPRPPGLGLIGESEALDEVRKSIRSVGTVDAPVLIRGESGTGKELVARAIVALGPRAEAPFVAVNVAALPSALAVSELFGHVKGAFTGALRDAPGAFQRADGGTLFLDEIGDAPADVQAMLLRALETGEIAPLGDARARRVDVRIIAATDADLESGIERGAFKSALLHRLAGFRIELPPLSARRDDVGRLLFAFLRDELRVLGREDQLDRADAAPWLPTRWSRRSRSTAGRATSASCATSRDRSRSGAETKRSSTSRRSRCRCRRSPASARRTSMWDRRRPRSRRRAP
jgi:two-component system nitrogen regulation response regulator GlnG